MKKRRTILFCEVCGNLVEVLHPQDPDIVCCGQPMVSLEPKTEDVTTEKHVPYVTDTDEGIIVKIGKEQDHPMEEKHYIVCIIVHTNDKVFRHELSPGDAPEAVFPVKKDDVTAVYEYCNIHGLWKS